MRKFPKLHTEQCIIVKNYKELLDKTKELAKHKLNIYAALWITNDNLFVVMNNMWDYPRQFWYAEKTLEGFWKKLEEVYAKGHRLDVISYNARDKNWFGVTTKRKPVMAERCIIGNDLKDLYSKMSEHY